jgi:hypothetical protein
VNTQKANYSYSYADLPAVVAACRKALTDQEIAIVQSASTRGREVAVSTRLLHSSGQWISDEDAPPVILAADESPQKVGSAITYARRYSLMAMVGVVASDEDDDGASAQDGWQARGGGHDYRGGSHDPRDERPAGPPAGQQRQAPPAPAANPLANLTHEELVVEIGTAEHIADLEKIAKVVVKGHRLRATLEKRYREITAAGKGQAA